MYVTAENRKKLLPLKDFVAKNFKRENWLELGVETNCTDIITGHSRLLRSLSWGDPDYPGNTLEVLLAILEREAENLEFIESYISRRFEYGGKNISSTPSSETRIYFKPSVFSVPDARLDLDLVSVMMPFHSGFDPIYKAIESAAALEGLKCKRVDNIWEDSTIVQDIFNLIFRSYIVVCDFTGRNANVFYEAGIAHTLGKHVIPITQSSDDIPFDLRHHRFLSYLDNGEGRMKLTTELGSRFEYLAGLRDEA